MQRVDRPRSSPQVVVAASDTAAYLQRAADYVCDGTADNVEIQAAIDLAQTFLPATSGATEVVFLPGKYRLAAGLTKKSANLVGFLPNSGVRIYWDGSAGGTMVTQSASSSGSCSFGLIQGLEFLAGTAEPATFIDLSADSIDVMYRLRELHLGTCTGDAIKVGSWVNCHWEHLRFDGVGGYAIRLTPDSSQNCSDFHLSDFTYDHHRASLPGKGVFLIDNSAGASNLGTVKIEHARIEINSAWDTVVNGATRAIFTLKLPNAGTPARSCGVHLSDLSYSDATGMADDCLFYRDTTEAVSGSEKGIFENITGANLANIFGGTYPATMPLIAFPAAGIGLLELQGSQIRIFSAEDHRARTSTDAAWQATVANEAVARLVVRADGLLSWSDGTNAADVTIARAAANKLTVTASTALACSGPIAPNNTLAKDYAGAGTPEGAVTAEKGSTYRRTDGGAGTSFYVKESGSGNTGWVGK
jgi:hypothetical protein